MTRSECGKLGGAAARATVRLNKANRIREYNKNPKRCLWCQKKIQYNRRRHSFCGQTCNGHYQTKVNTKRIATLHSQFQLPSITCETCLKEFHPHSLKTRFCSQKCCQAIKIKLRLQEWKDGKQKGWNGKTAMLAQFIRRYLFEKYNSKCCKCGWSEVHPVTGKIPLEANHIDGNAKNCKEDNLELICPNCHALTPNFRSLNRESCRNRK